MTVLLYVGLAALVVSVVALVLAATSARPVQQGVARSLALLEQGYGNPQPSAAETVRARFESMPGWVRVLAMRLSPTGIEARLQRRLDQAGNPQAWSVERILAAKGFGLIGLALLGALYGLAFGGLWLVVVAAAGGAAGLFLPDLLLYNAGIKRQDKIRKALPDALDMLTVCVEAGLGFDAALAQVARNTEGPLASEFARVLQEMQIGKSRSQALRAMTDRTTVSELRTFVSSLVQASELGIALATVLREQAKELRIKRRQRAEEQAQKVPVKIMFPLIFCIFPTLFIVVIGPGAIMIAETLFK